MTPIIQSLIRNYFLEACINAFSDKVISAIRPKFGTIRYTGVVNVGMHFKLIEGRIEEGVNGKDADYYDVTIAAIYPESSGTLVSYTFKDPDMKDRRTASYFLHMMTFYV